MIKCMKCNTIYDSVYISCQNCGYSLPVIDDIPVYAQELMTENDYMPSGNYEKLESYENYYFWFQARKNLILYLVEKYFKNIKSFCEAGCGGGFILSNIYKANPELMCYGTEIHVNALKIARKRLPQGLFFNLIS
ncbi:MAG: hypothetical protein EOM23_02370 [Candidatus Moranbacteria bacterium]|nr:hypothetical protein [Candidatus Moranbacteria bacterium]